jgi:DNA-binding HxlR family transcriptional regulator
MKRNKEYTCSMGCPVEATLDVIGGAWKGVILYHLMNEGVLRFNEMRRRMTGVSQRMLTKQLRDLERNGLIVRKVYPEVPPRVEYRMSERGKSLRTVIQALQVWGENYLVERVNRRERVA